MNKKFTVFQTEKKVYTEGVDPTYGDLYTYYSEKCFILDKTFNTLKQAQTYRNAKKRHSYIIIETY